MLDFIRDNAASLLTLLGVIVTQYVGWRLGRVKDDSERRKGAVDAEGGFRDDLMQIAKERDDKIERLEAKVEQLQSDKLKLEKENSTLSFEIIVLKHEIKELSDKVKLYEGKVFYRPKENDKNE